MPGRERPREEGDRQRDGRELQERWNNLLRIIYASGTPDSQPYPQEERTRPYQAPPEFMRIELERQLEVERRRLEIILNDEALQDARRMQQGLARDQAQPQTATQQWFGGGAVSYQQYYDAFSTPMAGSSPLWLNVTRDTSAAGDRAFEFRGSSLPDPNYVPYHTVPDANDAQLDNPVENVKREPKRRNLPR